MPPRAMIAQMTRLIGEGDRDHARDNSFERRSSAPGAHGPEASIRNNPYTEFLDDAMHRHGPP